MRHKTRLRGLGHPEGDALPGSLAVWDGPSPQRRTVVLGRVRGFVAPAVALSRDFNPGMPHMTAPLRFLPASATPDAAVLLRARAVRAFGDGFVSVLLPLYLT